MGSNCLAPPGVFLNLPRSNPRLWSIVMLLYPVLSVYPRGIALTLLAGTLFALRYLQTGSLFISAFEHALYGCCIFTIVLGRSFYHAARTRPWPAAPAP